MRKLSLYKSAIEATPEQGEQLLLFDETTFPNGKFKPGQVVWWNGWYPINNGEKHQHSKGGMAVTIKYGPERSGYGITYYAEPLHTGGSYYLLPEDLFLSNPAKEAPSIAKVPIDKLKVGDKIWWDGIYPTSGGDKQMHEGSIGSIEVGLHLVNDYGMCYTVNIINQFGSQQKMYLNPEHLTKLEM